MEVSKQISAVLTLLVIATSCLADGKAQSSYRMVASIGSGAAFSSDVGNSETFPIVNPITDEFFIYSADNATQTVPLLDVFLGTEWTFAPEWALQMGLGYHQAWNYLAQGSLLQGADTQSADEYAYQYDIFARQLMAEGKLLYQYNERFHPYLFLGLGASFNTANNYDTNVPAFLTFTREYEDHTQTSFTYSVGFGVDVDVAERLRIGIGYRFADFGQVELGDATIDTTRVSGTLSQTHLYACEILAQLTFMM